MNTLLAKINYFLIVLGYLVKLFVGENYIDEKLSKNTLGQQNSYAGLSFFISLFMGI